MRWEVPFVIEWSSSLQNRNGKPHDFNWAVLIESFSLIRLIFSSGWTTSRQINNFDRLDCSVCASAQIFTIWRSPHVVVWLCFACKKKYLIIFFFVFRRCRTKWIVRRNRKNQQKHIIIIRGSKRNIRFYCLSHVRRNHNRALHDSWLVSTSAHQPRFCSGFVSSAHFRFWQITLHHHRCEILVFELFLGTRGSSNCCFIELIFLP